LATKNYPMTQHKFLISQLHINNQSSFTLLKDLVEWGKATLGKNRFLPEAIKADETLRYNLQFYETQLMAKQIKVTVQCPENLSVVADLNMLNSILRNLISNAIKYTKQAGLIALTVYKEKNIVYFSITDNGIGMSEEKADELFSFSGLLTEKGTDGEKGHGIGLQLVKEYVALHKGEINVSSEKNKGTTVLFSIPEVFVNSDK